jgi:hypothetical protein
MASRGCTLLFLLLELQQLPRRMGSTVSQYENPVQLAVSFNAPENTQVVLQGPTLEAWRDWQESGDEADYSAFLDLLHEQLEDHFALWTTIDKWDLVR